MTYNILRTTIYKQIMSNSPFQIGKVFTFLNVKNIY